MAVQNVATNSDLRPRVAQPGAAAAGTYGQIRALTDGDQLCVHYYCSS